MFITLLCFFTILLTIFVLVCLKWTYLHLKYCTEIIVICIEEEWYLFFFVQILAHWKSQKTSTELSGMVISGKL